MAEIEDYSPMVIGLKLRPDIPFDIIIRKMRGILKDNGFKVQNEVEEPEKAQQAGFQINFGPPIESIGTKNNVEVNLNLQSQSVNIVGETPEDVMPIFEEVYGLLPELNYDIDELIPFYELFANVGIVTSATVLNVLTESISNLNLDPLKDEINPDLSVVGIRIGSMKMNLVNKDNLEIVIEPKKGSHSHRYLVGLRYQTRNKDNLINFDLKAESINLISSLEGE